MLYITLYIVLYMLYITLYIVLYMLYITLYIVLYMLYIILYIILYMLYITLYIVLYMLYIICYIVHVVHWVCLHVHRQNSQSDWLTNTAKLASKSPAHVYYIMVMRVLQSIMCWHEVFHVRLVHDLHGVLVVVLHSHTCRKKKSPKNARQARRYLARRVLSPLLGHKLWIPSTFGFMWLAQLPLRCLAC